VGSEMVTPLINVTPDIHTDKGKTKGGDIILRRIAVSFILAVFLISGQTVVLALEYCSCSSEEYPDLYLNSPNLMRAEVSELQAILAGLGYYQGGFSGVYDTRTMESVRMFQRDAGLAVDGAVRYHVWLKLAQETEDKLALKREKPAPPSGEVSIVIDTFKRVLTVFNDGLTHAQFPVAIGKPDTPSPIGSWKVVNKSANWGTGFGTRWMQISVPWGIYGIHGTNKPHSIGSMASHGCFRMFNGHVETIYPWIKVGTSVTVIGNPLGYMSGGLKALAQGSKNSSVIYAQEKLARLGFYQGKADGIYGAGTARAVKDMQRQYGLRVTGQIGYGEYSLFGVTGRR
jgi:peptidoglycan hydrolase-like protein with peptidoglycan-binding domain